MAATRSSNISIARDFPIVIRLKRSIYLTIASLAGPRPASKTTPFWFAMKVMTPRLGRFGRPGDQREGGNHVAVYDVIVSAAGDVVAPTRRYLKITVAAASLFQLRLLDAGPGRALAADLVSRPIQLVGRSFATHQLFARIL